MISIIIISKTYLFGIIYNVFNIFSEILRYILCISNSFLLVVVDLSISIVILLNALNLILYNCSKQICILFSRCKTRNFMYSISYSSGDTEMFTILMKLMLNAHRKIAQGGTCCGTVCGLHSGQCECQKFVGTIQAIS